MTDIKSRITLWGIEVFVAAADEGSISAAARRLEASPSGVSQQLTNLEAALGTILINRTTRPISLTPAGETFRKRALSILNEASLAKAEMAGTDMSGLRQFRLGMIEDFDADVTPRLLSDMSDDLQGCQFLLETGASHRLFDLLDTRALDMIVAADLGASADWMEVHPLMQEPFVAAVPKGLIAKDNILGQLKKLPLIQYTQRHHMGRQIAAHLARQNLTLNHRFELDSYHAIMAMVAAKAGWTILTPLGFLRARRFHQQVEMLELPFDPLTRSISLTARRDVLQDMPSEVAARLRVLLQEIIVDPAITALPWIAKDLKLL